MPLHQVQTGPSTCSQRRHDGAPPPPKGEVNSMEQLATRPLLDEGVPDKNTTPELISPMDTTFVLRDWVKTQRFLSYVAGKLPVLQADPTIVQVVSWLDRTVDLFCGEVTGGRPHHLAGMLWEKLPSSDFDALVAQGLTSPSFVGSFDDLKEHILKCVCGPSFAYQLLQARYSIKQGPTEPASEFLRRLTQVHRYLYQFGNGQETEQISASTVWSLANSNTKDVIEEYFRKMVASKERSSFEGFQEYLCKQDPALARKYEAHQATNANGGPCSDVMATHDFRNHNTRGRGGSYRGHRGRGRGRGRHHNDDSERQNGYGHSHRGRGYGYGNRGNKRHSDNSRNDEKSHRHKKKNKNRQYYAAATLPCQSNEEEPVSIYWSMHPAGSPDPARVSCV